MSSILESVKKMYVFTNWSMQINRYAVHTRKNVQVHVHKPWWHTDVDIALLLFRNCSILTETADY